MPSDRNTGKGSLCMSITLSKQVKPIQHLQLAMHALRWPHGQKDDFAPSVDPSSSGAMMSEILRMNPLLMGAILAAEESGSTGV
jgi:hypothetical protein